MPNSPADTSFERFDHLYRVTIVDIFTKEIMFSELLDEPTKESARDTAIFLAAKLDKKPSEIKIAIEYVPFC